MNSLEGVGESASSPPFERARLRKPLHGEQEKREGRNRTRDEEPRVTQLIIREFYFRQNVTPIAKYHLINYPRELFPCTEKRNVFNGTGG